LFHKLRVIELVRVSESGFYRKILPQDFTSEFLLHNTTPNRAPGQFDRSFFLFFNNLKPGNKKGGSRAAFVNPLK